jgi:hypothetical protein
MITFMTTPPISTISWSPYHCPALSCQIPASFASESPHRFSVYSSKIEPLIKQPGKRYSGQKKLLNDDQEINACPHPGRCFVLVQKKQND